VPPSLRMGEVMGDASERLRESVQGQAHARALLGPAVPPDGRLSHAYLFHGPAGSGKGSVARAFAAAILAEGAADREGVWARVQRGSHPDLTWVRASGAAEVLVGDVEPVVTQATRTPFESSRRVFVVEAADTLNDQAANRLLKTLEEPPEFVHLVLLSDRREEVLQTIASRCLHVRFDALPAETIAQELLGEGGHEDAAVDGGSEDSAAHARACARLALGDGRLARMLASEQGRALRRAAEAFIRGSLAGRSGERPWREMLEAAKSAGVRAGEEVVERLRDELELVPAKERKRLEKEALDARRRAERRGRARALELALRLGELWLRDLLCLTEAAPEVVHNLDRMAELEEDLSILGAPRARARARAGIALFQDTRLRLSLNVSEELALEALAYRL
jgi:DNA polymerase III subunit delta'